MRKIIVGLYKRIPIGYSRHTRGSRSLETSGYGDPEYTVSGSGKVNRPTEDAALNNVMRQQARRTRAAGYIDGDAETWPEHDELNHDVFQQQVSWVRRQLEGRFVSYVEGGELHRTADPSKMAEVLSEENPWVHRGHCIKALEKEMK